MILEAAVLDVKPGQEESFERSFRQAAPLISSIPGYISHQLQRCLDRKGRYLLLVEWERAENHLIGFRTSQQYQEWKRLLHHYYDPFPTVEHYQEVTPNPTS